MVVILSFFVAHWVTSIFSQTFFLHRYSAHAMVSMNRFWEKFFHIFTLVAQGPSFLHPFGYAVLHRMHHVHSDSPEDPHSPINSTNLVTMMMKTKHTYDNFAYGRVTPDEKYTKDYIPQWPLLDNLSQSWIFRILAGSVYVAFYLYFVPPGEYLWFLLLPVHFLMGPIHGAIVNWSGHKYGYTNFKTGDNSKNTLPFDFITMGELFQNNHHNRGNSINFGYAKWYEVDLAYCVIKALSWMHIVTINPPESVPMLTHPEAEKAA